MNRREALKTGTAALGGLLMMSSGVLASCEREPEHRAPVTGMLDRDQQTQVEEIADTLLPKTAASPGAKEANAGPEINLLLTDCYDPPAQQRIVDGLKQLDQRCQQQFKKTFVQLRRSEREDVLRKLSAETRTTTPAAHWFPLMRELSMRAYFSSEIGMTKALRYTMTPGKFVGCIPKTQGQPAWA